jgi:CBS domain-containing protein
MSAGAIMTSPVVSCHVDQPLQRVWETMNARSVRCVPILDASGRPHGVAHARDLACALLDEVNEEEVLLRDYVLGVGYQ